MKMWRIIVQHSRPATCALFPGFLAFPACCNALCVDGLVLREVCPLGIGEISPDGFGRDVELVGDLINAQGFGQSVDPLGLLGGIHASGAEDFECSLN